jgi:hypothetical protein
MNECLGESYRRLHETNKRIDQIEEDNRKDNENRKIDMEEARKVPGLEKK